MSSSSEWWNTERVNLLIEQWSSGISARNIALQLGCTRNTIMGKIFRLREKGALPPAQRKAPAPVRKPKLEKKAAPLQTRLPGPNGGLTPRPVKPSVMVGTEGISLMELQDIHCRAVIGHGPDGMARYCGQSKSPWEHRGIVVRSSYCGKHNQEYHNNF